ncbi:hypothetical protein [Maribacter thermophilus]|uniref:hypothetical protein n=1 Tax=Maribacter thermophilus TaxID=1197874 RepID=UPI00069CA123|nr:hypothetical protein [Maribacter thermophilus]
MKNIPLILLAVLVLFGCTSDDLVLKEAKLSFTSQKWELQQMVGSMVDSVAMGDEMEWQEYYIFNPDGSFYKRSVRDSIAIEASGTFQMVEYDNDETDYLELNYTTGQELAGSCAADNKEVLMFVSNTLISNTWMACDGPGLYYGLVTD